MLNNPSELFHNAYTNQNAMCAIDTYVHMQFWSAEISENKMIDELPSGQVNK